MQIYLVGGAIRDQLLHLPVTEKDWVVVGSTPEEMLSQGFQPVGKEFPVFLHPQTHEEYALARTERKVSKGYKGFQFYTSPDVSLEQDLKRRDLTINAMAQTPEGDIIDPYHGRDDLNHKILRHVSTAFAEDPVRILRLARFAARFTDFRVHADTLALMKKMVSAGEVNALVAERVWQELHKALHYKKPARFFTTLAQCNALDILFPGLSIQDASLTLLNRAADAACPNAIKFAILTHRLTPATLATWIDRYRVPNECADLAKLLQKIQPLYQSLDQRNVNSILQFINQADAIRRRRRWQLLLTALQYVCHPADHTLFLNRCLNEMIEVDHTALQQRYQGKAFGIALQQLQQQKLERYVHSLDKK